ncbi:MAG: hypothetical protein JWP87_5998, partial [Labilithrix sp.]|nr:hypothetical protein [Labilithrix sp.]
MSDYFFAGAAPAFAAGDAAGFADTAAPAFTAVPAALVTG